MEEADQTAAKMMIDLRKTKTMIDLGFPQLQAVKSPWNDQKQKRERENWELSVRLVDGKGRKESDCSSGEAASPINPQMKWEGGGITERISRSLLFNRLLLWREYLHDGDDQIGCCTIAIIFIHPHHLISFFFIYLFLFRFYPIGLFHFFFF